MSRAYIIYILTFVMAIGGLWLIMTMGAALRAPDDLSGEWSVAWENAPPPEMGEPPVMRIEQSGRFFVVRLGKRPPMSLTLRDGWRGARDGRTLRMELANEVWKLGVAGEIPLGGSHARVPAIAVELVGPTRHLGVARRKLPAAEVSTARPEGAAGVAHAR